MPGGFGVNDVMGVGRRSRAVDLSDAQRRALEQMALQQREQAMFEQAGLGRADEPYSDPLKGAWDKVANAEIPLDKVPGWNMPGWDLPIPSVDPMSAFVEGGPKGVAEWLNMVKYMSMPLMPRDFGASGEHANTPLVGAPKVIGTGVGLGMLGARAAKGPLGSVLAHLGRGGDEAVSAAAPVVRETTEAAGRASRPYFRNIDELGDAAQPAWPGGPTLFHGGPADMSGFSNLGEGAMIGKRPAMGNATYTTPDIQFASQYANQRAQMRGAMFRGAPPNVDIAGRYSPPTPSVVQNVRFAGEGAPRLIDYGKAGIDKEAQQAVLDTISQMDELLRVHPGTSLSRPADLEGLVAKLSDPSTSFDDIHGFASHASTGPQGSSLREVVEKVLRRNTDGSRLTSEGVPPFRPEQINEMMSIVMSRLSDNLSNAGYHGFVAPSGGGFHLSHVAYHGKAADEFGDTIAWFNPSKDLEILGTAQHNVYGSGYRADNWVGSPREVASRWAQFE